MTFQRFFERRHFIALIVDDLVVEPVDHALFSAAVSAGSIAERRDRIRDFLTVERHHLDEVFFFGKSDVAVGSVEIQIPSPAGSESQHFQIGADSVLKAKVYDLVIDDVVVAKRKRSGRKDLFSRLPKRSDRLPGEDP